MKTIIANWKLNPHSWEEASKLLTELNSHSTDKTVVICPPAIYLPLIKTDFHLGAQDIHWEHSGAHTGQISAPMVKQFNVKYVLIGHSELRTLWQQDHHINKKIKAALEHDLTPVLCVGSKEIEDAAIITDLEQQLKVNLEDVDTSKIILAYEPVWAIGTGQAASAEHAGKIANHLKAKFPVQAVLYGGSANANNAASYLQQVDGLLVGGASLKPNEFKAILDVDLQ